MCLKSLRPHHTWRFAWSDLRHCIRLHVIAYVSIRDSPGLHTSAYAIRLERPAPIHSSECPVDPEKGSTGQPLHIRRKTRRWKDRGVISLCLALTSSQHPHEIETRSIQQLLHPSAYVSICQHKYIQCCCGPTPWHRALLPKACPPTKNSRYVSSYYYILQYVSSYCQ